MIRRIAVAAWVLTLAASAVGSAQTLPTDTSNVVVLATDSLYVGAQVELAAGQLVVNNPAVAGTDVGTATIKWGFRALPGTQVIADSVTASSFRIKTEFYDLFANTTNNFGPSVLIDGSGPTPVSPLPLFSVPSIPTFSPVSGTVLVRRRSGSVTLAQGAYGDIRVGPGAILYFSGGTYYVNSIRASVRARVLFNSTTTLNVAQNATFSYETVFAPTFGTEPNGRCVVMNVGGDKVAFRALSSVYATINAPVALLGLGRLGFYEGNFFAQTVRVSRGVLLEAPPAAACP